MKILIDGPISGTYSLAIVNREFALALILIGEDVYLTQRDGPDPLQDTYFLQEKLLSDRYIPYSEVNNYTFDVHSKNDWPIFSHPKLAPYLVSHCYAWEETIFPVNIIMHLEKFDGIYTTSNFANIALRSSGYTGDLSCIGNGVDHIKNYQKSNTIDIDVPKKFRFLHISSGLLRKGMDVGIKSFLEEFSDETDVILVIKTHFNESNIIYDIVNELDAEERKKIELIDEDLSQNEMQNLILDSDFCFFPSRGEGFLLPAAEAMLLGVPVCVTACGGNQEFCNETTALIIPTTLRQARSHVTSGKSTWFEASGSDIRLKLRQARSMSKTQRDDMIQSASHCISKYTWYETAQKFLMNIDNLINSNNPSTQTNHTEYQRKITILSTYNQRCGISTYSENLARNFVAADLKVDVISERILSDEIAADHNLAVHRVWSRGKQFTNDIVDHIKLLPGLDTLLIQHHPGIFSWDQLTNLVKQLKPYLKHIIVELHSTAGQQDQITKFVISMKLVGSIIVHNSNDYIRIVAGSPEAKNILLFPHPVDIPNYINNNVSPKSIEIFSFGICLPHKQFEVIPKVVHLLRLKGHNAKAKIVTSIVSGNEKSISYAHDLWLYNKLLGLDSYITIINEFLSIEEILDISSSCNISIFPYSEVNEGASGAARVALSKKLPVIVSNSSIFEDLDGICERVDMSNIHGLAETIVAVHEDSALLIRRQEDYISYSSWSKHIRRICILIQ